jgi:hypothetical protein
MYSIKIENKDQAHINSAIDWLITNVGPGSFRTIPNTWLGTNDWFCYQEELEPDAEDTVDIEAGPYVFVFRRETDMTMFSLKWV